MTKFQLQSLDLAGLFLCLAIGVVLLAIGSSMLGLGLLFGALGFGISFFIQRGTLDREEWYGRLVLTAALAFIVIVIGGVF